MQVSVITAGKTVARYPNDNEGFQGAVHHARELSMQNRDVAVYVQDGNFRSIYRNGYAL